MRKIIFIFCISIILVNCKNSGDDYKTINGRWWYFDSNYKEIHAGDTSLYLFDFKEIEQSFEFDYEIKNDSFWTIPPKRRFSSIDLEPFLRGKVVDFKKDSFFLVKDSKKIVFHKLDNIEDIYTKKLPFTDKNGKRDSIAWNKWLDYQEGYRQRAIKFYDDHPELKYKGDKK